MNFKHGMLHRPQEEFQVGIAIKQISTSQNHVGILYRRGDEIRFSHLAFHFDHRDELFRNDYFWDISALFDDPYSGQTFAAHVLNISNLKGVIPYGIYAEGEVFSGDGEFIAFPAPGLGLTCATFILHVFASFGYELVTFDDWQIRKEDVAWQEHIIQTLYDKGASADHIAAMRQHVGCYRVKPEEIAAAAVSETAPLSYLAATALAAEIIAALAA